MSLILEGVSKTLDQIKEKIISFDEYQNDISDKFREDLKQAQSFRSNKELASKFKEIDDLLNMKIHMRKWKINPDMSSKESIIKCFKTLAEFDEKFPDHKKVNSYVYKNIVERIHELDKLVYSKDQLESDEFVEGYLKYQERYHSGLGTYYLNAENNKKAIELGFRSIIEVKDMMDAYSSIYTRSKYESEFLNLQTFKNLFEMKNII